MEELKKITRVMKKLDEDAPHEVMLTIDGRKSSMPSPTPI
jgi:signal recognition particle GTPase